MSSAVEKAKISSVQLFSLLAIFGLGTALVVPLGMGAKQDAWLAILLGLFGGVLLFKVYDYLFRQYPGMPLTSYIQAILGKYIGWPLGLLYIVFFIYGGARDLRDVGSLLIASGYDRTPLFVINVLVIVSVAYVIQKGIEVLARTGEILFIFLTGLGALGNVLVISSGILTINNLLPVLGHGWNPVLSTALSQTIMFPFGEAVCFTMILPYLNRLNLAMKTGIAALVYSGAALSLTIAVEIAVLGVDITGRSTFPLLTTISKVNIADFIQRMDAIVVFTLIITDFFKIAIFFYVAVIGSADLFKVQNYQKLVMPIGILIIFSSITIASHFPEHLKEGELALKTIFPIFSAGIPLLLLTVVLIRRRFGGSRFR